MGPPIDIWSLNRTSFHAYYLTILEIKYSWYFVSKWYLLAHLRWLRHFRFMSDPLCFDALKTQLIRVLSFTIAALNACDLDKFLKSIGRNPSYVDLEVSKFKVPLFFFLINKITNSPIIYSLMIIVCLPYLLADQSYSGERSTPWSSCTSSIWFHSFTRSTPKTIFFTGS